MAETESVGSQLNACAEKKDFAGAFDLVCKNQAVLAKQLQVAGICEALRKAAGDRQVQAYVDSVEFGARPLGESLLRLEKLLAFGAKLPGPAGVRVLNDTWGLGVIKKIDGFYRRITVDFRTRKGHQFTFAAACDMLVVAPDDHILVFREQQPEACEQLIKEKPGDFVKRVIVSNGKSMTLVRLEDYCVSNGFVKAVNWKKFWDLARVELKRDKYVVVPAKKTEPIEVRENAEDFSSNWVTKLSLNRDAKSILASVREYVAQKKFETADEATKKTIGDRLAYAATAARKVDDALYARIASQIVGMGFLTPPATEMRAYLWERKRYIKAAAALPAREVGDLIVFLACDADAKAKLYATIPEFCFTAVQAIVEKFGIEPECRAAIGALMKQPAAPATLTTLIVGKYESYKDWAELPGLMTLLSHAIALGEGRQGGETLKMQNVIRRLFGNTKWLEKVFGWLSPSDQVCFFERFQASIAWDPSTHHTTVIRMTHLVPSLEEHLVKVEKKKEYARLTSFRSFGLKKQEYLKLINEDMPENVRKIEFAKGFGDLSENAEYQYAKDEQRALMQKQTLMQADLETVKPSDFADATTDEVMPGVTVVCQAATGEKTWHILGEWDNDIELGILSSKTRVAENLLGKKVGDNFELPGEDGQTTFATVKAILPLPESIREWMKLPAGVQI